MYNKPMTLSIFWRIFPLWIKAFTLTLVIETPVFVALGRLLINRTGQPVSTTRLAIAGALGTCLTHPLLWFVWPLVIRDYMSYVVTGEILVALIETFTFFLIAKPISLRDAALASFAANAVSVGLGYLLQALGWM